MRYIWIGLDLIGLDWIRYIYQSKVIQVSKNAAFLKEDCVAIKDNALFLRSEKTFLKNLTF